MTDIAHYPFIIVGAGLWGCVLAQRIAENMDRRVLVIDKRSHTGGNCHSYVDPQTGIECHAYGTHIFHTKNEAVWAYLSRFTAFTPYRHKVLTEHNGRMYQMPIGLATINSFYGRSLKPFEALEFIATEATGKGIAAPANLEEKAVSLIGRPLYEAFIKGYTQKQWNLPADQLPADIISRLPVRTDYNPEYFNDYRQGMPLNGYHALFMALLDHARIDLRLNTDFRDIRPLIARECTIFYSGPIDAYFDYTLGELSWRSLRFEQETLPYEDYQGTSVVNQADLSVPYTRTHEFKHLHPERSHTPGKTIISREFPADFHRGAEAYYPVNRAEDKRLLERYQAMAREQAAQVVFGGRLGGYAYNDMDVTIANALQTYEQLKNAALP